MSRYTSLVAGIAAHHSVTTSGLANPILVAGVSMLIGAMFGFASERFANALETRAFITSRATFLRVRRASP